MSSEEVGGASAAPFAEAGTEVTAGTDSAELEKVRFNNKLYDSWEEALLGLQQLINKNKNKDDKPHLADCHVTLLALRKHVVDWSARFGTEGLAASAHCPVTSRALTTHGSSPGCTAGRRSCACLQPCVLGSICTRPLLRRHGRDT